ncbi:MAG: DEAD/DEAH box helicase [Nanoarchaeota archaeon]|nr:DEAD/DEAH box helicase [Nanoarchaeota archaeon]
MHYKGLLLDKFQEEAIQSIENNHSVVVSAPTGSGKTLIADYIINKDIKKGIKVIYTAPIKALSNQKYKDFCEDYGKEKIGLLTGDIVKNPSAPILIMTTEIYRNMALSKDPIMDTISYVVFDEIHYINDIERGYVWEESIIFSKPKIRFLCLSATIPNAKEFAEWIEAIKKHKVDVITHDRRAVPLEKKFFDSELGITSLREIKDVADIPDYKYIRGRSRFRRPRLKAPDHVDLIKNIKDKLPCLFFNFSRKKCQDNAYQLMKADIFRINPEIRTFVRNKLESSSKEIKELESSKLLLRTLPYGIAFHHAGLIPIIKEMIEELFGKGLIKVLYTTETFAVGINMPAKSVCFESLRKFDGVNFRFLNSKEYFQIAGRAGRRGIDKEGFVYAMIDRRDFDYNLIKKITDIDVDPILSQFKLSVNTILNLIKNHEEDEIDSILKNNFFTFQKYGKGYATIKRNMFAYRFEKTKKRLEKLNYVKGNKLTAKGEFSSQIYADEILIGEMFATEFYLNLNEYQILMILACICYESREKTEFYEEYPSDLLKQLDDSLMRNSYTRKESRFNDLYPLTSLIHPCCHNKSIFDIMENTNLLEGDLIRFFRQILDRINQIKKATKDERLKQMLRSCQDLILNCLRDIGSV